MSDQSQGPGWWVASDGKWYPPQPQPQPPGAPTDPGYAPTEPVAPVAPVGPHIAPYPPGATDPTQQWTRTGPPPGYPAQPPTSGPPIGGTPVAGSTPSAGEGGSKTPLLIGLAVLVVFIIGGGIAFALNRSKDDPLAGSTTSTISTTSTASAPGSTTAAASTTTTEKKSDGTSTTKRATTTTTEEATTTTKKKTTTTVDSPTTSATTSSLDEQAARAGFIKGVMSQGTVTLAQANCIADVVEDEIGWSTLIDQHGEMTQAQKDAVLPATIDCMTST